MLAAFAYDLSLRNVSDCRTTLADVYRELFHRSATGQGSANEIIIKLLSEQRGLELFTKHYVESAAKINLEPVISPFGIQLQRGAPGSKLAVTQILDQEQRKLLGCLRSRN